ncbi:MAG: alpha/beta hydrolase family protein [Opitutia bacterium]|jgi:pimeloyl-ACP methyl ester carboxylesterase
MPRLPLICLALLCAAPLPAAVKVEKFQVAGADVTLKVPEKPAPGRPWLWVGEFAGHLRTLEDGLVEKGWHVAYVRQVNRFGSPGSMKVWESLYDELHGARDLSPRPALLGISRGGLYVNAWARLHPDRVSVLYLDNGVCDIRSWPGGVALTHQSKGSPKDWALYKAEFGYANDDEAKAKSLQAAEGLLPVIKAGVFLISCHGTADKTVPYEDNAAHVVKLWKDNGGRVKVFPKEGGDHHPHGLPDSTPLIELLVAEAK